MQVVSDLRETLRDAAPRLQGVTERQSSMRAGPGKWSAKEILGHLIDSAANNHQRFVRCQEQVETLLPAYGQDHWVRAQAYHEAAWIDLLELWTSYNRHLLHVMSRVPERALAHLCRVGTNAPVTLEFLMADYVVHMRHHLDQIMAAKESTS